MKKYERLTRYIDFFEKGSFGEWVIDREHDGTRESPAQIPYVAYSEVVESFIKDAFLFVDENPNMKQYHKILDKYHLGSIEDADVSTLPAECSAALIVGVIRSEHFCDGAILDYFENGCIVRWLNRLRASDEQ